MLSGLWKRYRFDVARRGSSHRGRGRSAALGAAAGRALGQRHRVPVVEPIEARVMLSVDPVITEFMANNKRTLEDRYGDHPDWIEIYNPDSSPLNLDGWYLTTSRTNLTDWRFPAEVIPAGGYLVVFASGRDERVAGQELHASFNLDADGDYLALVKPDGFTIASEYAPEFPEQVPDISYGLTTESTTWSVLGPNAATTVLVPEDDIGMGWIERTYNDAAWLHGTTGIGFDETRGEGPASPTLFYGPYGPGGTWNLYEVVSSAATWANARSAAMSKTQGGQAGHLVTIGSSAENSFVQSIIGGDSWIGFTDDSAYGASEGNWRWVTGQAVAYTRWTSGQPDNRSGGQSPANFAAMTKSTGRWSDYPSGRTFPYVIEYDLNLAQQPPAPGGEPMPYRFSITEGYSPTSLNNTSDGINFLAGSDGARITHAMPVINFVMPGDNDGHFGGGANFKGVASIGQTTNFALQISATLRIPTAGQYTFGINSDDGFRLRIDGANFTNAYGYGGTSVSGDTLSYPSGRGANDSFGVATLAAGEHRMELVYYQGGGDASLEFFAAEGFKTGFDSSFRLVGDTANGGLQLVGITDYISTDLASAMHEKNSSAYIRVPFDLADVSNIGQLTLKMRYDDGFIAYINGQEVARSDNAPAVPQWNSVSDDEGLDADALVAEDFNVSAAIPFLVAGQNVLAIHALNASVANPDLFILPELQAGTVPVISENARYFLAPTPGKTNSSGTADLGPIISNVAHGPAAPTDADDVVVTAQVRKALSSVSTVTLHYRVFDVSNETEISVPMHDDGLHGDGQANDGVYGGTIPASAASAGQLVRYYVTANDSAARTSRWPLIPAVDPDPTSRRKWPEYEGFMIPSPSVTSTMPILYWFVKDLWATGNSRAGTRGSVVFNGEFYDNVFFRQRGGYSVSGSTKIQFNRGYFFRFKEGLDRVSEINLNVKGRLAPDDSWIRPVLAFEVFRLAGAPASFAEAWRVQANGQYHDIRMMIEDPDDGMMERYGFYGDGELFKTPGQDNGQIPNASYFEKKNPDDGNYADLQWFLDGIHQSDPAAKANFVLDNLDIARFISYQIGIVLTESLDSPQKNYYLYRDTNNAENPNGTNEWMFLPWDEDLTFGKNYGIADYQARDPQAHPFFGDSNHPKIDGPNAWNYLVDAALDVPVIKEMYLRRLRSVMDELLQPDSTPYAQRYMETRLDELYAMLMGDADFKARVGDLKWAFDDIKTKYLPKKRTHLYIDHSQNTSYPDYAGIPSAQPPHPYISFGAYEYNPSSGNQEQEYIVLRNDNGYAVDISGWKLEGGVSITFEPGTVIPANSSIYVSPNPLAFRNRSSGPRGGQGLIVVGPYSGQLSARGETIRLLDSTHTPVSSFSYGSTASAAQDGLRITEIMYNPADDPSDVFPDNEDFEFIELQNISGQTINLNGVRFTDGIGFTFGNVNLGPGQYIVVVRNRAAFESRYGVGTANIAGEYWQVSQSKLDNSGERIRLVDAVGEVILDFRYDPNWHWSTDKGGRSLVIRDADGPLANWGASAGWRASALDGGSPGQADPAPATGAPTVSIGHVEPETRPAGVDSMTIVFSEPVSGFTLSDLTLTRGLDTTNLLTGFESLSSTDGGMTWELSGLGTLTAPAGKYKLTVLTTGGITDAGGNPLAAGDDEGFVVDPDVPTVTITPVSPDPQPNGVSSITFTFSKAIAGFDLGDLRLRRDGVELLLTVAQTLGSGDGGVTWVLGGLSSLTAPLGSYELLLDPDDSGIWDKATGTKHLAGRATEQFVIDTITVVGETAFISLMCYVEDPDVMLVHINDEPTYQVRHATMPQIRIDGQAQNNILFLTYGNGDMLPPAGLSFEAAAGTQASLHIDGGGGVDVVEIAPGMVTIGGKPVAYTHLDSVSIDTAAGADTITITGSDTPEVRLDGAGDDVVSVDGGSLVFTSARRIGSLSLSNGGRAALGDKISFLDTPALSIAGGGVLDLKSGNLIIRADDATRQQVFEQASQWIKSGLSAGTGIISSAAASTSMTGLAALLNERFNPAGPFYTQFAGRQVDENCILVKYTWEGDANLDGMVNADDYFLIDSGFISQQKGWYNGDFNYDEVVNADDYFLIDSAFIGQTGRMAASFGTTRIGAAQDDGETDQEVFADDVSVLE